MESTRPARQNRPRQNRPRPRRRGPATVINVRDPHVIVPEAAAIAVPRWVVSDTGATKSARVQRGDASGVRGAAWRWPAS
jgi:fructokinase